MSQIPREIKNARICDEDFVPDDTIIVWAKPQYHEAIIEWLNTQFGDNRPTTEELADQRYWDAIPEDGLPEED